MVLKENNLVVLSDEAFSKLGFSDAFRMDDPLVPRDAHFSTLAMALNAMERSCANKRLIARYRCPCNDCKGGGRPILRLIIKNHLRRQGRDPCLTHCMLVSSFTSSNAFHWLRTIFSKCIELEGIAIRGTSISSKQVRKNWILFESP